MLLIGIHIWIWTCCCRSIHFWLFYLLIDCFSLPKNRPPYFPSHSTTNCCQPSLGPQSPYSRCWWLTPIQGTWAVGWGIDQNTMVLCQSIQCSVLPGSDLFPASDRSSSQVTRAMGELDHGSLSVVGKKVSVTKYANYFDVRQPRNLVDVCPKFLPPRTISCIIK